MTGLILFLVLVNVVAGDLSVTGRRLQMSSHPVFVRLRWFGFGAVCVLLATGHEFSGDSWLAWVVVVILLVGVARFPSAERGRLEISKPQEDSEGVRSSEG